MSALALALVLMSPLSAPHDTCHDSAGQFNPCARLDTSQVVIAPQ